MPHQSPRMQGLYQRLFTLLVTMESALEHLDAMRDDIRRTRQPWGRGTVERRKLAGWRRSLKYRLDHWEPMELDAQTLFPPEEQDGT